MEEREFWQELIGWLAFEFSILIYLLPYVEFYKLIKGKISIEETPRFSNTILYKLLLLVYIFRHVI